MKYKNYFALILTWMLSAGMYAGDAVNLGGIYYMLDETNLSAKIVQHQGFYFTNKLSLLREIAYPQDSGKIYSVDSIGVMAFWDNHGLTKLIIPNSVKKIDAQAFAKCTSLAEVYVSWDTTQLKTLQTDSTIFQDVTVKNVHLHVPYGTKAMYDTIATWKDFNIIDDGPMVGTSPTAITGLIFDGEEHELIAGGTASAGIMCYRINDGGWTADIPTAFDPGQYTVSYKVVVDDLMYDYTPDDNTIAVNIAPKPLTITVDNKSKYVGEQDPEFTATIIGLCGSDNISLIYTRAEGDTAGVYQINATCNPQPTNYSVFSITPGSLEIKKLPSSITTNPTGADSLVYSGSAQALLNNDGVAVGGTLNYSLDNSTWSEAIPSAIPPGNYTVYYMVVGDATHSDYTPLDNTIAVSIAKAPLTIKADDTNLTYGDPAWWCNHATYTGFVNGEDVTVLSGAVQFDNEYSTGSNVGVYTITPYGVTAANYDITFVPGTVTVDKADVSFTAPTAIAGLEYNGAAQTLINAGSAIGGEMQYKLGDGAWSTELPQATDADDYTVWYKVIGDANHNDVAETSIAVSIAAPSAIVLTANEDPQHAGVYYSTFYHSSVAYELSAGVEAYVAELSGDALILTKIAEGGQVIPIDNAVILKANSGSITLTPSDVTSVSFVATNSLQGTDVAKSAPANCYVLSGHSTDYSVTGVGFYQYTGTLKAHKAYAVMGGGYGAAPKKLRFVFEQENTATAIEEANGQQPIANNQKILRNGQLIIIRGDKEYNAQGKVVK